MSPRGLREGNDSRRVTVWPWRWHSIVAVRPPKPAPTMITLIPVLDLVSVLGEESVAICNEV